MAERNAEFGPPWTTLKMLNWMTGYFEKQGLSEPRLDAEILLGHALGMQRIMIYAHFDRPLSPDELDRIRALVKRRAQHEPIAYITGSRGFWRIELKTDKRALIPRPDTETLVEAAIARLPDAGSPRVLDVGTGSGAIALAIAHDLPHAAIAALDISAEALSLARENAAQLELTDRVDFFESDLLEALPAAWREGLDMIVSNPPYIAREEEPLMGEDVKRHEPHLALFAERGGLEIIARLVPQARAALRPGEGWLLCEIGFSQAKQVSDIFDENGFSEVSVLKDLGGKNRVVLGRCP